MARAIDKDYLLKHKRKVRFFGIGPDDESWGYAVPAEIIENAPTLTPPNEWVSVEERLPEPGERVLATDCGFVGEFYINKRGKWQRYNVNCYELLMALDILYWMPLPAPPDEDNNVLAKTPNEPLTLEQLRASPHGKIKDSTLQSICNRANEIACRPPEGEEDA